MFVESLGMMVLNWLRIPPGTSVRKNYGGSDSAVSGSEAQLSDLVKTIVDITRDDICFGNNPVFVSNSDLTSDLDSKVHLIVRAFNDIIRWACFDVLTIGYSVYKAHKSTKGDLVFLPILQPVEFYLNLDMSVVLVIDGHIVNNEDFLVFLNYEKQSLELCQENVRIDGIDLNSYYKINPIPVQLKNAQSAMNAVTITENSILAYRKQLAKIVRIATVDVGVSQGDVKDEVVESISSALNANSTSLNYGQTNTDFDDSIPVVPHRNGLGQPSLITDVPSADINNLADLDYDLNKLYLTLRFPKSYADFSQSLSVVSTLRGDIRYNRMIEYTRTLLISTMNEFLQRNPSLSVYDDIVSMSMLPTPEDDDVIASLDSASRYAGTADDYVFTGESRDECLKRLDSLRKLLSGMSSFDFLTDFFTETEKLIDVKFPKEDESQDMSGGDEFGGGDMGGPDFGGDMGGPDFGDMSGGAPEEASEPAGEPESSGGDNIEYFAPAE